MATTKTTSAKPATETKKVNKVEQRIRAIKATVKKGRIGVNDLYAKSGADNWSQFFTAIGAMYREQGDDAIVSVPPTGEFKEWTYCLWQEATEDEQKAHMERRQSYKTRNTRPEVTEQPTEQAAA